MTPEPWQRIIMPLHIPTSAPILFNFVPKTMNQKGKKIREDKIQMQSNSYSPLHPCTRNTSCQDSEQSRRSILAPSCEDCNHRAWAARTPSGSPDTALVPYPLLHLSSDWRK